MGYDLPSIEELMARKLGRIYDGSSFVIDKDKIRMRKLKEVLSSEVHKMLRDNQMLSPPFDPFNISGVGKAKIRVVYATKGEIGADGSIETEDNGFLIRIDKTLPPKSYRLRSTMAHELMHTFFYDTTKLPPVKMGDSRTSRKHFLMEEELCLYLAREFLMPSFYMYDLISEKKSLANPSLANIEYLKNIFIVSSEVIGYRMIRDAPLWNAIFIKLVQDGSSYKSKTILKYEPNKLFRKIVIPHRVPLVNLSVRENLLSHHIIEVVKSERFEEIMNLYGKMVALESMVETVHPKCIITIIYEEE